MIDRAGLEVLSEEECFRLLTKAPIGRIVFTDRALPAIQPVNFAVHDRAVIIRVAANSRLATAASNAVVAFEVDEFDRDGGTRTGWDVVVVGHAAPITDPDQLREARQLDLRPWAPGIREHYIRIDLRMISGRRILPAADGGTA
ncbi:pyridoxamine 5'-phosphate oxidase family protein [Goodfellowiella coeruleoviolacea]|uniref:Nitroimidazol reductase NimA, pyridoxamine 5'-phosphate oxidase superfamily n=1 Tax=Goodfellowiella coeruleoviolacea TaxID=334858 RepID=A0AAE3GMM0_9PSEU|nr:pyridoxamine 5'-phosphate oxidase family protein [Goodfellowiella coeruleoviolacea]MCP2170174.1 Nitroimidazol reductase NimA, pyridoxamine 5'-phosphate oxidase superfamily [Goodfellowiella coeruleoviolacea]